MLEIFKREFMLGIGAGLIISGIMVSLSGNGQLTDAEVMTRAAKLGMVQKQGGTPGHSGTKKEQPAPQQPEPRKTEAPQPGQMDSPAAQKTTEESLPSSVNRQNNSPGGESNEPSGKIQEKSGDVTIQVKSGMGSESITRLLEEKGVINDREEFYKVLTKYKAHSRLKVGTFKIPAGAGMKEIVDILTGKSE